MDQRPALFKASALKRLLALAALCGALTSCGGEPGAADTLSVVPAAQAVANSLNLPALPELAAGRTPAASAAEVSEPLVHSNGCTAEAGGLRVQSTSDSLSWAIWGWYGFNEDNHPQRIELALGAISSECWLAIPDFSARRWKFSGPHSGSTVLLETAALSSQCTGPDGTFYLALVCHDGSSCRLDSISVDSGPVSEGYHSQAWLAAGLDESPQFIQLEWPQPLKPGQAIYRWAANETETEAVVVFADPESQATVHWDHAADYGSYYNYRICAEQDGQRWALSPRVLGRRSLPPAGSRLVGRIEFDSYSPAAGEEIYLAELNLYTSSGPDGRYSFSGLPDGSYNLWHMENDPPLHIGLAQVQGSDITMPTLSLPLYGTPQPDWYWLYPPLDPQVEALSPGSLALSWSPARYATGYRVYRSRFASMADLRLIGETSDCSITLTGEPGGDNYYCLRAIENIAGLQRSSEPGPAVHFHAEPLGLLPDSIYAVAEQTLVDRGSELLITVYARETAQPLRNLNMLRLSFESGNRYVAGSFNIGAPGGLPYYPDGLWNSAVAEEGFLDTPDNFMRENDLGTGRSCIDFNITPLLGNQTIKDASGALFNFRLQVNCDTSLSFIRGDNVARTFYTGTGTEIMHWANDLNEGQPPILVR